MLKILQEKIDMMEEMWANLESLQKREKEILELKM